MSASQANCSQRSPRFGFKRRVEVTITDVPEPVEEPPPPPPTDQKLPPLEVLLSLIPFSPSINNMEVPPLEFVFEFESCPQVDWPDDDATPIDSFMSDFSVFEEIL
jgi:hypothetical protein